MHLQQTHNIILHVLKYYISGFILHIDHICVCMCAKSRHLCLTLFDSMDCSWTSSSVHGILQARILEWAAIPSSRGSSRPRD